MVMTKKLFNYDEGTEIMEPCILRAAETGDIEQGKAALKKRPDCIKDTDSRGMNALQIAVVCMQSEFGLFILKNTEAADFMCLHEDHSGTDAEWQVLLGGSRELKDAIHERSLKEHGLYWEAWDKENPGFWPPSDPKPKGP